jgi:hypothetical protein
MERQTLARRALFAAVDGHAAAEGHRFNIRGE